MLFKNYINIFSVKILSVISLVFMQFMLAKQMSVEDYGVYSFVMSLNLIVVSFVIWGLDKYTVKAVSLDMDEGRGVRIGFLLDAAKVILINCALGTPIIFISLYYGLDENFSYVLGMNSVLLLVVTACAIIISSVTKGTGRVVLSELNFNLMRPLIVIAFSIIFLSFFDVLESHLVIFFMIVSYFLITIILVIKNIKIINTVASVNGKDSLYTRGVPYLVMGAGLPYLANIDILLVGVIKGSEDVAVYSIATKMVGLVLMGLVSANMLIMPKLAVLYKNNKIPEMQKKVKENNVFIAIITVPAIIGIVSLGEFFLLYINPEYVAAVSIIEILLVGQIINVLSGPVNLVCAMAGQQVVAAKLIFSACVIQTLLCYLVIPDYGVSGAAISNVIATVFLNLSLLFVVIKNLNFNPSFFSIFKKV